MGFRWFWSRISDEWIVSSSAAVVFGVAAVFTCLLTVFLFSSLPLGDDGIWSQIGWGTVGVLGPLSAFFLWGGMRRYQKMRGQSQFADTRLVRFLMLIGLCWTAVVYYLTIFLPKRLDVPLHPIGHDSQNPRSSTFKLVLIGAWVIFLALIQAMFLAPKTMVRMLHGASWLPMLVMLLLMFTTAAYLVIRFVRGPNRS